MGIIKGNVHKTAKQQVKLFQRFLLSTPTYRQGGKLVLCCPTHNQVPTNLNFSLKKTVDQWITFEVKIEKYENLLSLDQMTMIGDYISDLAKVTRCVNLKVDCFIKFEMVFHKQTLGLMSIDPCYSYH